MSRPNSCFMTSISASSQHPWFLDLCSRRSQASSTWSLYTTSMLLWCRWSTTPRPCSCVYSRCASWKSDWRLRKSFSCQWHLLASSSLSRDKGRRPQATHTLLFKSPWFTLLCSVILYFLQEAPLRRKNYQLWASWQRRFGRNFARPLFVSSFCL